MRLVAALVVAWSMVGASCGGGGGGPPGDDAGADGGAAADGGDVDGGAGLDGGDADGGEGPRDCGSLPAGILEGRLGAEGDTATPPERVLVLMGGGLEVDEAARRFVEGAAGGDVLVLRASGAVDTYTPYFFEELGADPAPASAATLRLDDATASADEALLCRVDGAEALWLAGGDQWDYLGAWDPALAGVVAGRAAAGMAVGGTSAGAMVLGEAAFTAATGSLTSDEALQLPELVDDVVQSSAFAQPELLGGLVDTHFSARDREGRLLAFLGRLVEVRGGSVWGLGLDERAALVVANGGWRVLAGAPERAAWLYVVEAAPEQGPGEPLTLTGVRRARLDDGQEGAWPASMDALSFETLDVVAGEVVVR